MAGDRVLTLSAVTTSLHAGADVRTKEAAVTLKARAVSQTQVIRAAVGRRSAWL
jgi:hypothetical protein